MTTLRAASIAAAFGASASNGETLLLEGNTGDVFIGEDGCVTRLTQLLATLGADVGLAPVLYSAAHGARQLPPPGTRSVGMRLPPAEAAPAAALHAIVEALAAVGSGVVVIVDHADLLVPATPGGMVEPTQAAVIELLADFANDPALTGAGHRLVVIARTGPIDGRLTRAHGTFLHHVGLPGPHERELLLTRVEARRGPLPCEVPDLVAATGGLTLDDLFRLGARASDIDATVVQARKRETLRRIGGDALAVYDVGPGLSEVAGLPQIRRFLRDTAATGLSPRALLLAGPPGGGKTYVAKAIAGELGWPAAALGTFRSMWVGETERTLRRVLDAERAMAPVVIHVDEMDQALGQRNPGPSSDAGTSERVLADLWAHLGDRADRVQSLWVFCTNRPDLLDPASLDRVLVIPLLHPTPAEAAQILVIAAGQAGRQLEFSDAQEAVGEEQGLFTGRTLVDVITRASTLAALRGSVDTIAATDLRAAFADLLVERNDQAQEYMALQALSLCSFASYLPWEAASDLGLPVEYPPYVPQLLDSGGHLDLDAVHQRLDELEHTLALRRIRAAV